MSEKVTFKFFEGRDVDQFTFYRIPKQLFTVSYFKGISCEAKVLYGLMLDRISLSVKNQWFDENNRAYIYFTIDDVMELLGCGKNKAIKCLKELDVETGIGLTQKRRQGFGKSNMIYVKTFLVESKAEHKKVDHRVADRDQYNNLPWGEGREGIQKIEKQTSVGENGNCPDVLEQTSLQDTERLEKTVMPENKDVSVTEIDLYDQNQEENSRFNPVINRDSDNTSAITGQDRLAQKFHKQTNGEKGTVPEVCFPNLKKSQKQTSRSPENKLLEVYYLNPNNTEYNKTEYSDSKSYRIVSDDRDSLPIVTETVDTMRYDGKQTERGTRKRAGLENETGTVSALIWDNIDLDTLVVARPGDKDLIMEIYSLIVEMVSSRSEEIVIASSRYPAELVRSRFLKLGYDHINYVIDCLEKNTTKVKNIRKYLLATLFNAPVTMDGYYRAEVRHDMPEIIHGSLS